MLKRNDLATLGLDTLQISAAFEHSIPVEAGQCGFRGLFQMRGNMTRDILPFPFLPEHSMIGFRDNGLESLRSKLRNMTETELVRFGKAAQERCLKTVEKKLLIELEEARAEWRRRHPKRRTNS